MSYSIYNISTSLEENNIDQPNITTMAYKNNKLYLSCYKDSGFATAGRLYILNADNTTTTLYSFPISSNVNGVMPIGQIYISSDGNTLYGITKSGGSNNKGTFYKISNLNSTPSDPTFISIPNGNAENPVGPGIRRDSKKYYF